MEKIEIIYDKECYKSIIIIKQIKQILKILILLRKNIMKKYIN